MFLDAEHLAEQEELGNVQGGDSEGVPHLSGQVLHVGVPLPLSGVSHIFAELVVSDDDTGSYSDERTRIDCVGLNSVSKCRKKQLSVTHLIHNR